MREDRQPSIIAFEGFDECLRDAVGFWRADWRETRLEAQGRCGVECVLGDVPRAVVGQPFDGMRRLADPESTLDTSYHQVAHHLAGDAGGGGQPTHNLAIAGIDSKQHTLRRRPPRCLFNSSIADAPKRYAFSVIAPLLIVSI